MVQGRYRVVRCLGNGGMGAVYEAVDERLGTSVALKQSFSVDQRLRAQFQSEARLLASLAHPALPRVTDYFSEAGRNFLVMQFIEGVDLAEILVTQPGPLPRERVIAWADQLLDALIYLHTRERQITHRDIKPHNLKLTKAGSIALLDFGLARADSPSTSPALFGYTRRYAPLEQITDGEIDARSDIYALGATLYHLLTGVKPPDAQVRAQAAVSGSADPLVRADVLLPVVGAELSEILCRAMAQRPEDRFETASEFRHALAKVGREPVIEPDEGISAGAERRFLTGGRVGAVGAFVFLLLLGFWVSGFLRPGPGLGVVGDAALVANATSGPGVVDAGKDLKRHVVSNRRPVVSGRQVNSTSRANIPGPYNKSRAVVVERSVKSASNRVQRNTEPLAVKAERAVGRKEMSARAKAAPVSGDEVLRAPDGTEVVKFRDGHVRAFQRGERRP